MKTTDIINIIVIGTLWIIFSHSIIMLGYFIGVIVGVLLEKYLLLDNTRT